MIFNMAGGGSGLKSAIIVTAPAGSTVTCALGDTVKTAPEKEGTWTFSGLDLGTWIVTAALGESSRTVEVPLDRLVVVYLELAYKTYILQDGYIDLAAYPCSRSVQNGTAWDGKACAYISCAGNGERDTAVFSNITVPAGASTFRVAYLRVPSYDKNPPYFYIGSASVAVPTTGDATGEGSASIDVSAMQGTAATFKISAVGCAGNYGAYITDAWFE